MPKEIILELINKKIKEHEYEVREATADLETLQGKKTVENASKFLVLKDKIVFHRACLLTLQDLKEEINNV